MLTREQAKEAPCPYIIGQSYLASVLEASHNNSVAITAALKAAKEFKCRAEECPKWADTEGEGTWMCPEHKNYIREHRKNWLFENALECATGRGLTDCDSCPRRYGRCGG